MAKPQQTSKKRPQVVVLGGGFGGLRATRELAGVDVDITVIDRVNHHVFQPLLYQVAGATLSGPDIAAPLRFILRNQKNVTVWMAEVDQIDVQNQQIHADGQPLSYDYLVVATGASHAYFGHEEWAQHAPGLKTMNDALAIRRRILTAFEQAERETDEAAVAKCLTFVVVGAGPTGVELVGSLAEMAHHTLPGEFRSATTRNTRIHLVEAGPRVLPALPDSLSEKTQRKLEKMGVEVHLGQPVTHIDDSGAYLGDEHIASNTVLWAAGVAASSLGEHLGGERDRAGRVMVADDLSLPGHDNVFVVGDLAHIKRQDGRPVPGVAPAAKQMGGHAAKVIKQRLQGKAGQPFHYNDYGSLAYISNTSAVADLRGIKLSGFIGWLFWVFAHIMFLIGFRNRFAVMGNWTWSYLTRQRHARIVVGDDGFESKSQHDEVAPSPSS